MGYWQKRRLLLIHAHQAFLPEPAADSSHLKVNEEFRA
jgi:hypothetical protein